MKLQVSVAVMMGVVLISTAAEACSWPSRAAEEAERQSDMREITAIYEATLESIVLKDEYGDNLSFTLQPSAPIWGTMPSHSRRLDLEAGSCMHWFVFMDEHSDQLPTNGTKVVVMEHPAAVSDPNELYILRANARYVEGIMSDWRTATGRSR